MVPVASNTAVMTNARTLGNTTGFSAPMISRLPISELPASSFSEGIAKMPEKCTVGSKIRPKIEIPMMVSRMPPGTFSFSRPMITARPIKDIMTGKLAKWPSATGKPSSGFLITKPTPFAAISSRNRPIPIPVPCATPIGKLRKIQLRIPVAEIIVNSTPIRNTAPNATGTLMCWPSTRLNAVNAVSEIAQPMASGRFSHKPISREPTPATRQVATKTAAGGKPALPSMPGTTITEYTIARKVVKPATTSWRTVLPRADILNQASMPLVARGE
ncbi:hypothetical protein D3C75_798560 [compost metagenome]